MNLKKSIALLLLMLVAFGTSALMAQSLGPIPVDPEVRIGKLDCGLTYYIRHNDYPEHRVDFYIAQRVGSIQEEESQRGLAHFLEHMAFNGSEHFHGEGKNIHDFIYSLGASGLNAYTSFDETVYNINGIPSTRQSAIDSCLLVLKDWSGGLLLTDEEIDKERGVIHEEWRMRRSAEMRMLERQLETLHPDSKYGRRMPIGLMSVVDNFEYQELRDYYHKWYRPDNQALVIVGDVDVDHIEAQIKELFKDCVLDPNAPQVTDEPVGDNDDIIIAIDKDKERMMDGIEINFKCNASTKEEKSDMYYLVIEYFKKMVIAMANNRLSEIAQEPDCPFMSPEATFSKYVFAKTKDSFSISAQAKEGKIEAATQALMTEVLRITKHGFTATEYERARDEYMSSWEKYYNKRDKISNTSYCNQYCSHFLANDPIPSIEQHYQIISMIAPSVDINTINQAVQSFNFGVTDKNMTITNFNTEKDGAVYPTVEGLKGAIAAARNSDIQPYVDNVKNEPLMTTLPKKGKIVKETRNDHLGYTELQLNNGARVILKKTDFKQDEILMSAFQRGGQSLYNEKDYANLHMLNNLNYFTGLGQFSNSDVSKALAGKQVNVNLNITGFTDNIFGNSTVKDLETLFQLTYLKFTALTKDEKKFNQVMSQWEAELKNKDLVPMSALFDTINCVRYNYNWRNRPYGIEDMKQANLDRIMEIAKERTANAAGYTFLFVGSFDDAIIRQYIEQYIASLPAKKGKKFNWNNTTSMPQGQVVKHFTHKMSDPQCHEVVAWHSPMPYSQENDIKSFILAHVLYKAYYQKIREDNGASYAPMTEGSLQRDGDFCYAYVYGYCPVNPEYRDMVLQILNDEMKNACTTVDAARVNEAKESLLKSHSTRLKENWYWQNNIWEYLIYGTDDTGFEEIVNAQTPETIAAFARQLYNAGNRIELVMSPEE